MSQYRNNRGGNSCSVDGCDQPFRCSGYCAMHYARLKTTGAIGSAEPVGSRAGIPNRPKTATEAWCLTCLSMLPLGQFADRRGSCRSCEAIARLDNKASCPDCGSPRDKRAQRCLPCSALARRGTPLKTGRSIDGYGYVRLSGHHDHPNSSARGVILEHVKVMSELLGRGLLKGENVHHINGVRDDNRPENLELWSTSQPAGQRVPDKVQWAKDLLALYEPNALAVPQLRFVEEMSA